MEFRRVFYPIFSVLLIVTSISILPPCCSSQAQAASSENEAWFEAVRQNNVSKVKKLLDKGTNPDMQTEEGTTALMFASATGHEAIAKALLDKGASPDIQVGDGFTALILASESGHEAIAKALLDKGANPDIQTENGTTALMFASIMGHEAIVKILLDKGNLDIQVEDGFTALMFASFKGHEAIAKALLEKGANPDIQAEDGTTALILASIKGHEAIVKILLDKATIVIQNFFSKTTDNTAYILDEESSTIALEVIKEEYVKLGLRIGNKDSKQYFETKSEFKKQKLKKKIEAQIKPLIPNINFFFRKNKFCSYVDVKIKYDPRVSLFYITDELIAMKGGEVATEAEEVLKLKNRTSEMKGSLSLGNSANITCNLEMPNLRCFYIFRAIPDVLGERLEEDESIKVRVCTTSGFALYVHARFFGSMRVSLLREDGIITTQPIVEIVERKNGTERILWTGN